jgi:hypothetical protein
MAEAQFCWWSQATGLPRGSQMPQKFQVHGASEGIHRRLVEMLPGNFRREDFRAVPSWMATLIESLDFVRW